ncbi:disease resistance-like protein DSC1 [Pyrus communis]|uniref:disease resistance-like protein DSC1 n=1 Tax=Pyrus communis TaxID=23211 RepID=UPI0035C24747
MNKMADSSSDSDVACQEKYDVFLSFRGVDTRDTFTSHLYAALVRKKIETYIDYKLESGDKIAPNLLGAIEKSKLSVVIFSKNYASSTWCLEELAHILECKDRYGQIVVPIFYGIDPSHVRKQQGSYGDAFAQLEQRFKDSMDKVLKWRAALTVAADISGFDASNKTGTEAGFVEKVAQDVLIKLNHKSSSNLKGLVGIEIQIEQIESLLCIDSPNVCTVGIWGMGGIGKTTLAEAVFHRLTSKFEASCFLPNVREESERHGLKHLRNVLLREILNEKDLNIDTPSIGRSFVRERLSRTTVLIVLDDVNDSSQLELLVGDDIRFGRGSRIIITTRDRRLLKKMADADKIFKVEGLSCDEALQLFHLHAFKNDSMGSYYAELSRMVVDYAGGIPLALIILGSLFLHCESKQDWEDQLNELKKFPNRKIQNVLRLSYDGLEKNAKEIFLDIACFYKGMDICLAKEMLDIRGFFAGGIKVLIDKSLISISEMNCLEMHDLLQEMGLEMVREQCIEEPGKRSRLFIEEDVSHVLKNNTGTAMVECIFFNMSKIKEIHLNPAAFKKMYNLRVLEIYNSSSLDNKCSKLYLPEGLQSLPDTLSYLHWEGYPLKYFPSNFSPQNLVNIQMAHSQVEQLWSKGQKLANLKVINFSFSKRLTEIPDLSLSRKIEHINLGCCKSLVEIPSYFQYLDKLSFLGLRGCSNLKYLPELPISLKTLYLSETAIKELPSSVWSNENLSHLDIEFCKDLENLPSCSCKLKFPFRFSIEGCSSLCKVSELPRDIQELFLNGTAIETLPSSIECLFGLTEIGLKDCKSLVSLPTSICKLKCLEGLDLTGCSKFECFPEILEPMEHLKFLSLKGTAVKELPSSIEYLSRLLIIDLKNCQRLVSLPKSICKLKSLWKLNLKECCRFNYFPEILEPMERLEFLSLRRTAIKELPSSIENLIGLETLDLRLCKKLEFVPSSIYNLNCLRTLSFDGCSKLKKLPSSSFGLNNLEEATLSYSGILEIPDRLVCLPSLRGLDLRGTMVKWIPASIKQASRLSCLLLNNCKSLQSLPELPGVRWLEAHGCTSLEKVSSLRTQLVQGCDDYEHGVYGRIPDKLIFSGCLKLDENAWNSIMDDAHLRIMQMTASHNVESLDGNSLVTIVCPGNEIPNQFGAQNEGSSINISLPPNCFGSDFLGFVFSLLVEFDNYNVEQGLEFGCKSTLKGNSGKSHEYSCCLCDRLWGETQGEESNGYNFNSDHVFVWYNTFDLVGGAQCSTALHDGVTEASVEFYPIDHHDIPLNSYTVKIKRCGVRLLYADDTK